MSHVRAFLRVGLRAENRSILLNRCVCGAPWDFKTGRCASLVGEL